MTIGRRRGGWLPGLLALLWLALALPSLAQATPLTVFAAASLQESLEEAAAAYQAQTGSRVRVSYAASSALARQIEQGAPAQVFVSADEAWMDYLQQRGRVDPATRRDLLGNTLVLVAPRASATRSVDLASAGAVAAALGRGRLAIAQTAAPATAAAAAKFNLDPPLQDIVADAKARAALDAAVPGVTTHESYEMFKGMSLNQLKAYAGDKLTPEVLGKAEVALAGVK